MTDKQNRLERAVAPYLKPRENEDRKRALKHIAVGTGIVGAATAAEYGMDRRLKRKGVPGPVKAAVKGQFKAKTHLPHLAGRAGTRSLAAAGVPVAAYGAWNIINPKGKVDDIDLKRDVIRPALDHATMRDQREKLSELRKSLTQAETTQLVHRKERSSHISRIAGGLGVAALAARAPQGAKALVERAPKRAGSLRALKRLAVHEPRATAASNTLGIASIGTGAIGSMNSAKQQKLEAKQIQKSLYHGMVKGIGRVRVVERTKPGYVMVYDSRDAKRFMPESRVTPVKKPKAKGKVVSVDKPAPEQLELFKADKFLREYGDRISPKAEEGYKHLKRGRNRQAVHAAAGGSLAALSGSFAASAVKGKRPGWAAAHGALGALNAVQAVESARGAARWNARMDKIKAKAKERAMAGEYGKGRLVAKADKKKDNDKRGAFIAGAGAGAVGAAVMPTAIHLPDDGGASDRIAQQLGNRNKGRVNIKDVRGVATGRGERFAHQQHQDRLSANMADRRDKGQSPQDPSRPIKIKRTPDGKMRIADGHHRVQSLLDLGETQAHVEIENVARKHRAFVPLVSRARYQRNVIEARKPNGPRPLAEIRANAARPMPRYAEIGNKVKSRGERVALKLRKPSSLAGLAGVSGALAGGALMRHRMDQQKVGKALMPRTPGVGALPRPTAGWLKPKLSAPKIRPSYIGTSPTGRKYTVRGTVR